jgi:hypothetical protein
MTHLTRRVLLLVVVVIALVAVTPATTQAAFCTTVVVNGNILPACSIATAGTITYYSVVAPYPTCADSLTFTIGAKSLAQLQTKAVLILGSVIPSDCSPE